MHSRIRSIRSALRHHSLPLLGLLVLALGAAVWRTGAGPETIPANSADLETYARQVMDICSKLPNRVVCYDEEIPKLMDKISMEDAFKVTGLIQQKDDSYWYCHVLSHKLVAREVAKDPEGWKSVFGRCPDDMCSNGCFHGVFQERFKAETVTDEELAALLPELKDACEPGPHWQQTEHIHTSCHHGIGHLLMYITDADIMKSAEACAVIGVKDSGNYVQTCTEGLFMQLFQPRPEPEDLALVEGLAPPKEKLREYCSQFPEGMVREACNREGWVLFGDEIRTAKGIMNYCSYADADSPEHNRCLNKMFMTAMTVLQFDEPKMRAICGEIPEKYRAQCFQDVATRLITADKNLVPRAVALCDYAAGLGHGEPCYDRMTAYADYIFAPGSEGFVNMCRALPDVWERRCLAKQT